MTLEDSQLECVSDEIAQKIEELEIKGVSDFQKENETLQNSKLHSFTNTNKGFQLFSDDVIFSKTLKHVTLTLQKEKYFRLAGNQVNLLETFVANIRVCDGT